MTAAQVRSLLLPIWKVARAVRGPAGNRRPAIAAQVRSLYLPLVEACPSGKGPGLNPEAGDSRAGSIPAASVEGWQSGNAPGSNPEVIHQDAQVQSLYLPFTQ